MGILIFKWAMTKCVVRFSLPSVLNAAILDFVYRHLMSGNVRAHVGITLMNIRRRQSSCQDGSITGCQSYLACRNRNVSRLHSSSFRVVGCECMTSRRVGSRVCAPSGAKLRICPSDRSADSQRFSQAIVEADLFEFICALLECAAAFWKEMYDRATTERSGGLHQVDVPPARYLRPDVLAICVASFECPRRRQQITELMDGSKSFTRSAIRVQGKRAS